MAPRPSTVLVVDDDASTRNAVRIILARTRRFKVVAEASTGDEGVRKARETRPDVVVLDVEMPGMSGVEALPLIKKASTESKIVLFSDRVREITPVQAASLGVDVMVAKSPDLSALVPALLGMSGRSVRRRN